MIILEFVIRVVGITLLLVLAAAIVRDAWSVRPARFGFFLAITLTAVMATSVSENSIAPPDWTRIILTPLGSSSAIFIWWYSLSLFDDDFRLGPVEWSVAALWTTFGLINLADVIHMDPIVNNWATKGRTIMAIGFCSHILYAAIAGRKADLIERRRRVRAVYAIAISALFLIDLLGERIYGIYFTPIGVNIIQLSAFVAVIIWSLFWLMRMEKSIFVFEKPAVAIAAPPPLTPKESALESKLTAAMDGDKVYLDPALSIGGLAEKIGAPEHQLRALINKSMGHRNFRSYLNGYRMAAAKDALADPAKAALPILTIAMDSGFASLASFNRAFKQSTGATPSDYRNAAFSGKSTAQN